ncbi:MAG TPA: HEAT repeat domain-containing protein [Vineibacter sp.]|nr:HEAT repeat domain-containing protein [Vineibacter sp.]
MEVEDATLIEDLARSHRAAAAIRAFMGRGVASVPALVEGLQHPDAEARYQCCRLLDRWLTADAMQPLLKMLDDPDARVRVSALHSLSCDRCKTDACLPTDGPLLKKAIQLLDADPDAHVRAMALEAVGRSSHIELAAEAAIVRSMSADPSPAVRKKARWYAPGGKIHERSKGRHHRQASRTGVGIARG